MKSNGIVITMTAALLLAGSTTGIVASLEERRTAATRTASDGTSVQETDAFAPVRGSAPTGLTDPDLEPGFPVQAPHGGGTYHSGAAIHTTVAEIDGDAELEIVVTALANGSLWAWNADGSVVTGWPPSGTSGAGYAAAGRLDGPDAALEIFAGFWGGNLVALQKDASSVSGWPRAAANFVTTPPAVADVDGDGVDEIFVGEEDWRLHAYRADGTVLDGWPVWVPLGGQERHTPAVGDLDGDGDPEIVTVSGWTTPGVYLFAWHHDGTTVDGFPVSFPNGYVDTFPAIGDVDGDFVPEIVVALKQTSFPWYPVVTLVTADGAIERQWTGSSTAPYGTAPALADLDGDTVPEIVLQTDGHLSAWDGFGQAVPGWPVAWSARWLGNSAPVVGDVTGDGLPNVIVTTQEAGSSEGGEVRAFDRSGVTVAGFPKSLPLGSGAVPAVADVDRDGRNEIVVTGSFWNLFPGSYDKVWVFDLGGEAHGSVQWGQLGGAPSNAGTFATRVELRVDRSSLHWTANAAASGYDLMRGDLRLLLESGGDFAAATVECAGENVATTSLDALLDPAPGEGFWYVARPVTTIGSGSYDSGGAGQAAPRDAALDGAQNGCE